MELTIEAIEKVMEATGLEYKAAKELLGNSDNDPDKAIESFVHADSEEEKKKTDDIVDRIKKYVAEGNVDRIQMRQNNDIVLSVPVNIGIIGGIIGAAAAPWAFIAGTIAAIGLGYTIEVVKKDGTTDVVEVTDTEE